ncbi:MAG: V-type ATP synthase subunit D [Candidatus Altiarchaeota archaeon]|nr:V-type ATP synthase subunit D [Candidatus Altiarchaeota archaeon]
MADIIEGVHPTRMELIEINKRIVLAVKGHKLLKEKRDALMTEFLQRIDQAGGLREELAETLNRAYEDLIDAEARMSIKSVQAVSSSTSEVGGIDITFGNIFGVRVPKVVFTRAEGFRERYDMAFTSSKLDESVDGFERALKQVLNLVEKEETIRLLGEEIKKTTRRVNALEYVLIPRLYNTKRYIKMRLEEMERESFVRLKMVKAKKERERAKQSS